MLTKELNKNTSASVRKRMEAAFPYEERRDWRDELNCFEHPEFHLVMLTENGEDVGFSAFWEYADFIFLEHLAVDENCRSNGIGTKFLTELKKRGKAIILEAEPPLTDLSKRRIEFYRRNGFFVNGFEYMQPSYHGGAGVPLCILSCPEALTQAEFENFLKETRLTAYHNEL